ncbi:MAG: flippase-like domain-containing protein [Gemmataceae bacterium]|nr:flippase-like domain-containing protein [Gemmataceae bacterium]
MSPDQRKRLWLAAETVVAVVVVAAVAWSFRNTLKDIDPGALPVRVRAELLIPAGVLYLLAHLCWAAFWVRLLRSQGASVPWAVGLRAYYVSQFGKYIPGKVAVPTMRVMMLRHHGAHPIPVAVTATYETLTSMSAGALFAVLFLPALGVLPAEISGNKTALFAVVALPLGLGILNKLAVRIAKKKRLPDARPLPSPSIYLLLQGLIHGTAGYLLLALSLGLTIRGLVPDAPAWTPEAFERDLAAVAVCYVVGFVFVVAPGGLGAREFVLQWALAPQFAEALGADPAKQVAVLVALALRLTWTVAEVVVGLVLYAWKPAPPPHPPHPAPHA